MKSNGKQKYTDIYEEYLPQYRNNVRNFRSEYLINLTKYSEKAAKANYKRIKSPKIANLNTYTRCWVQGSVYADYQTKTLKKLSTKSKDPLIRALADFNKLLPFQSIPHLRKKIYHAKPNERDKVLRSFDLPYKSIEDAFISLSNERNNLATVSGNKSFVDFTLKRNKIPLGEYKGFLENINSLIKHFNDSFPKAEELPDWFYSKYNNPCLMCRMANFPFSSLDEVAEFMTGKHPQLKKYYTKIRIDTTGFTNSHMLYKKEDDCFLIYINKEQNFRHQAIDLIHELSHVASYIEDFNNNITPADRGLFLRELGAFRKEYSSIRDISRKLLQAQYAEYLLLLRRVLFELDLYKIPEQDLGKLYAISFNRCFKGANQEDNPLYILDEAIVVKPLSTLAHAVAIDKVIR